MTAVAIFKKLSVPALIVVAIGGLLVASGQASAIFDLSRSNLRATGTIVDIDSDSFVMDTGGTEPPFEVSIDDRRTHFRRPLSNLADLDVGDDVEVRARVQNGNEFEARTIERIDDYGFGYGNGCERLRVRRAVVLSVTSDEIIAERSDIDITVEIHDGTRIRGYRGNRQVNPGDTVDIRGDDCAGSGFTADRITIRRVW